MQFMVGIYNDKLSLILHAPLCTCIGVQVTVLKLFCIDLKPCAIRITVNVLKLRTLKIIIFSAVRNFRNYVYEKRPVFEILECGLYHEKNGIYACQNVIETC